MKKLLLLIAFTLFSYNFSQSIQTKEANRFLYELTYKVDSTNLNNIQKEYFYLDFYDKESRFASEKEIEKDSTMYAITKSGNNLTAFSMIGKVKPKFKYYVIKNFDNNTMQFYDIGLKSLYYEENLVKIPWTIQSETKKFGNTLCQKATANLYGRNWTAWFTKEIPINDGPYKFSGLPGLIINLYDEKQDYVFLMIKNVKADIIVKLETQRTPIKLASKKEYLKARQQSEENPLKDVGGLGIQLSEEMKRDLMNRVKTKLKTENNPLELKP